MAEWSNDLVLQFLEIYAAEPVLYDPKHPYHKNKKMINNAWQRIQQNFSIRMPIKEIKKKKDSLMASFRYQIRRRKEANAIGEPSVKTSWFAFDFMYGFLGQIYKNEIGEDSGPVLEFVGFDALDDSSPNDSPSTSQDDCQSAPQIKQEVIDFDYQPQSSAENDQFKLNQREQKTASKRKLSPDELQQEDQATQNCEEDDCDLYGKLIAKKLRKLPETQREGSCLKSKVFLSIL